MLGDLAKTIALKHEGLWEIEAWTFISNYPIPESIATRVLALGREAAIDVAWQGPAFIADVLRDHQYLMDSFPELHMTRVSQQISQLQEALDPLTSPDHDKEIFDATAVPSTPRQTQALIGHKSPGWEYLLYAGTLRQGRDALDRKWDDEQLQVSRGDRRRLASELAIDYLVGELARVESILTDLNRVFDAEAQDRAFGAPGVSGDPARIENLARHVVRAYEDLLDWAAELRALVPPDEYEELFEIAPRVVRGPIEQLRRFVDDVVVGLDPLRDHLAGDRDDVLEINVRVVLDLDEGVVAELYAELARLRGLAS
jgi:hypothetical protein